MTTSNPTLPTPAGPPYRTLAIASLVTGAILLLLSACAALTFIVLPFFESDQALSRNTAVLSLMAVFLGYGAVLAVVGIGILRNRFTERFRLPSPLVFVGFFFLVLVLGQAILALGIVPAHLFPLWHVLASLLVPLAVLSFALRRLEPVSLRSMLAQFSWGGLVTITLALVFELLVGGAMVIFALIAITILLGAERAQELADLAQAGVMDPQPFLDVLMQQPLTLAIAALTAILLIVVVVPLLEELIKAGGPAILIARRQRSGTPPNKSEALLWGLAAGAGYAFTENMFNTQGALTGTEGITSFWAAAMTLRAGTSLMHMIATATVAVGWYYALVLNQRNQLLLFLAAAVGVHAVWNSCAILLGGVSALSSMNPDLSIVMTGLTGCVLLLLAGLFVGFLFWLRVLIRWAQPSQPEIFSSRFIGSMTVENAKEF